MAIKIYFEKAYNKIKWSFIQEMLLSFNFPSKLIELIMSCISSVSSTLLFNGGYLKSFRPSRGIRQGDPLSPYLFIICMEFLSHLIERKCDNKSWTPVKTSKNGLPFSHLFFADDLVLFAHANLENYLAIKDVISEFCTRSGQTVSAAKSRVYFSPNMDPDQKEAFLDILGFTPTSNLGKCLGFPLKHPGNSRQDFSFVLDRVKKTLAG